MSQKLVCIRTLKVQLNTVPVSQFWKTSAPHSNESQRKRIAHYTRGKRTAE